MYQLSLHRNDLVDVAMRSVIMDDIAQSVAHLTDHILSTFSLPKTSRSELGAVQCCTSGRAGTLFSSSSDICEGTLGFTNHTKFLQNLCGGPRSWRLGKQLSLPWLQARFWSPGAAEEAKLSPVRNDRNVLDTPDGLKIEVVGTKLESLASEQSRVQLEESSVESASSYGNPSAFLLESVLGNEQVNSGSAVSKEDLGRATWTFLHTLAAQFPEHPTKQQQRDAKDLMAILSRMYPCKECADHFKDVLKAHPVEAKSGEQLAQWMCRVHNVVNRSLGKAQFPCHRVDFRWGALDCNEGACDLHGRLYK